MSLHLFINGNSGYKFFRVVIITTLKYHRISKFYAFLLLTLYK